MSSPPPTPVINGKAVIPDRPVVVQARDHLRTPEEPLAGVLIPA